MLGPKKKLTTNARVWMNIIEQEKMLLISCTSPEDTSLVAVISQRTFFVTLYILPTNTLVIQFYAAKVDYYQSSLILAQRHTKRNLMHYKFGTNVELFLCRFNHFQLNPAPITYVIFKFVLMLPTVWL